MSRNNLRSENIALRTDIKRDRAGWLAGEWTMQAHANSSSKITGIGAACAVPGGHSPNPCAIPRLR